MPYKLYGEAVYEHEFTVDLADGSTTTLGIVPATDSLQCGRGLLARVDGLERVLLDKHGASSMAALRDLERGWAQLDELKLSRAQFEQLERGWAQFEELRENSAQLDEYRSRKAEIEKLRSQMTSEQRKLDDVKTMAIIQHYEGTTGGTGPSVGTGTNSGSSAAPSARSTAVDEPAAKRRRHGGGQHSPAASLSAWPTHSALPHITCIVRVLNPGATTNERQYCAVVRTPSGEAWERVYGRDGPRPPSLVTGWEAALKRFGGIETTSDSASASATVEGPTLSSGMDPPSPGRSTEGSCTPGGPKGTIADLRRVIPQPSTSRTSMVTRGGGGRRTRSSQPRPLYDVLKDSALCVDGEDGMFVVLDKAVLDELRGHSDLKLCKRTARRQPGLDSDYMRACLENMTAMGLVLSTASPNGQRTVDALVTVRVEPILKRTVYPHPSPNSAQTYTTRSSGSSLTAEAGDTVIVVDSLNRTEDCTYRTDYRREGGDTIVARCYHALMRGLQGRAHEQRLDAMAERASVNISTFEQWSKLDLNAAKMKATKMLPEVDEACRFIGTESNEYPKLIEDIVRNMPEAATHPANHKPRPYPVSCVDRCSCMNGPVGPDGKHRTCDVHRRGRLIVVVQAIRRNLMRSYAGTFGLKFIQIVDDRNVEEWIGVGDLDDSNPQMPWLNTMGEELNRRLHFVNLSTVRSLSRLGDPQTSLLSQKEYAVPQFERGAAVGRGCSGTTLHHPDGADLFGVWQAEGQPAGNPRGHLVGNPNDYHYYQPLDMQVVSHDARFYLRCTAESPRGAVGDLYNPLYPGKQVFTFHVALDERVRMRAKPPGVDADVVPPVDAIDDWDARHHQQWHDWNWARRAAAHLTDDGQHAYDATEVADEASRPSNPTDLTTQHVYEFTQHGTARRYEIDALFKGRREYRHRRRLDSSLPPHQSAAGISGDRYR